MSNEKLTLEDGSIYEGETVNGKPHVRFDGVYYLKSVGIPFRDYTGSSLLNCLRFYEDGTVLFDVIEGESVNTDNTEEIKRSLSKENIASLFNKPGKYNIIGNEIAFQIKGHFISDFKGTIMDDGLLLKEKVRNSKRKGSKYKYLFAKW
jgi:hypothetical protein